MKHRERVYIPPRLTREDAATEFGFSARNGGGLFSLPESDDRSGFRAREVADDVELDALFGSAPATRRGRRARHHTSD